MPCGIDALGRERSRGGHRRRHAEHEMGQGSKVDANVEQRTAA
jgi:hypothetical protein